MESREVKSPIYTTRSLLTNQFPVDSGCLESQAQSLLQTKLSFASLVGMAQVINLIVIFSQKPYVLMQSLQVPSANVLSFVCVPKVYHHVAGPLLTEPCGYFTWRCSQRESTMPSLSSLSDSRRLAQFSKVYAANRPLVQRLLTTSFVFYVVGSTYFSLSAKPDSGKQRKPAGAVRPTKVAVSTHIRVYPNYFAIFIPSHGFNS